MKLLVSDANIFIDMECGGLIQAMFRLPETFLVPDVLYQQELADYHPDLPTYGLQLETLTAESVQRVLHLQARHARPGTNDLFALSLAIQESCPLLTGDKHLRETAKFEKVKVYGTVWLMERMLDENIISARTMVAAYERMRVHDRRLPWRQIDRRLRALLGGDI